MSPDQRRQVALTALAELTRAETADEVPESKEEKTWSMEASVAFARVRSPHSAVRATGLRRSGAGLQRSAMGPWQSAASPPKRQKYAFCHCVRPLKTAA